MTVVSKFAVVFAAILLLSLGLCGITIAFSHTGHDKTLLSAGLTGTVIGVAGLALTVVAAIIVAIVQSVRSGPPPPPPRP